MPTWRIVLTGCGTSHGNPAFGVPERWSEDPRDARRRSGAVLLGPRGQVVLIDVGPDLLHQLRDPFATWDGRSYPAACITRCDGVLLTHVHADHCHGVNDLRHLNRLMGSDLSVYGNDAHLAELRSMFPYCFAERVDAYQHARPGLRTQAISDGVVLRLAGLPVVPFALDHGPAGRTTGFRCGRMAYCTDLKSVPDAAAAHLHGLDLLVLDMLREAPHPTHLCLAEALAIIARFAPRCAVLTHLGPEVLYAELAPRLPNGVVLAMDGLMEEFRA